MLFGKSLGWGLETLDLSFTIFNSKDPFDWSYLDRIEILGGSAKGYPHTMNNPYNVMAILDCVYRHIKPKFIPTIVQMPILLDNNNSYEFLMKQDSPYYIKSQESLTYLFLAMEQGKWYPIFVKGDDIYILATKETITDRLRDFCEFLATRWIVNADDMLVQNEVNFVLYFVKPYEECWRPKNEEVDYIERRMVECISWVWVVAFGLKVFSISKSKSRMNHELFLDDAKLTWGIIKQCCLPEQTEGSLIINFNYNTLSEASSILTLKSKARIEMILSSFNELNNANQGKTNFGDPKPLRIAEGAKQYVPIIYG